MPSASGSPHPTYVIVDVGPGGEAFGLNDNGQVVGDTDFRSSHSGQYRWSTFFGFVWQNGARTELGTLGGVLSGADRINKKGQILGQAALPLYDKQGFPILHPCLWDNGRITDLETLPGYRDVQFGDFAPDGRMLFTAIPSNGNTCHVYLYDGNRVTEIGLLNEKGVNLKDINSKGQAIGSTVAGHAKYGDVRHACLWQHGNVTDLGTLGGDESEAKAINDKGQIVGAADTKARGYHAFLWENGKMRDLGILSQDPLQSTLYFSSAEGINNKGQIVGSSQKPGFGSFHGFIWGKGQMTDLNAMIPQNSDWYDLDEAWAINNEGQIVGDGLMVGGHTGRCYLLSPKQ